MIRAANYTWPTNRFPTRWRPSELDSNLRLRAGDFLIAQQPMALQVPIGLIWHEVEQGPEYRYYKLDDWRAKRPAGKYGLVVVERAALKKYSRVSIGIRLRLASDSAVPDPVRVILHRGARVVKLDTLEWGNEGRYYTLNATTKPFATSEVRAVSLEFNVKGGGLFGLRRPKFELLDASAKKTSRP